MEPQDDPEARIRELERPLTDQAQTSELGATKQPVNYPPPLPYPDTYPSTQTTTGRSREGWLLFAVLAVGVVAVAVGAAIYGIQQFSRDSTGGVSFPTSEPRSPNNRPDSPGSATQSPALPSPGSQVSIAGFDKHQTIACNYNSVSVSGFSNTIVITGHCASLTVAGSQNTVTVDAAEIITASGFANQVTFHSGSPRIEKSGQSNVVEQG